ncbi:hypothetical protein K491DRAFT_567078, partial [Lophiostoma macrostomum CBS 122681]
IPLDLQQHLLNVFRRAFSERLSSDIQPLLQEVKGHLYNRDFVTAFGRQDYLEAYAARWSPARALGYLSVLIDLKEHLSSALGPASLDPAKPNNIVCLGGGAGAELTALAGFLHMLAITTDDSQNLPSFEIVAIDMAGWRSVVNNLRDCVTTPLPTSKDAPAAAQAANAPLTTPENFQVAFHQRDVLHSAWPELEPIMQDATLITLMFTLNELYSTSVSLTQKLLLSLTASLQEGALLLVVDSAGSYSSVMINGAEKKYPMQWLLDHTLLKDGGKDEAPAWMKIAEDESRWFRLADELKYPIELENMRFQLHLYQRL